MPRAEQEVLKAKVLSQGSSLEVLRFIRYNLLGLEDFFCVKSP